MLWGLRAQGARFTTSVNIGESDSQMTKTPSTRFRLHSSAQRSPAPSVVGQESSTRNQPAPVIRRLDLPTETAASSQGNKSATNGSRTAAPPKSKSPPRGTTLKTVTPALGPAPLRASTPNLKGPAPKSFRRMHTARSCRKKCRAKGVGPSASAAIGPGTSVGWTQVRKRARQSGARRDSARAASASNSATASRDTILRKKMRDVGPALLPSPSRKQDERMLQFGQRAPGELTLNMEGEFITLTARGRRWADVVEAIAEQHGLNMVAGDEVAARSPSRSGKSRFKKHSARCCSSTATPGIRTETF